MFMLQVIVYPAIYRYDFILFTYLGALLTMQFKSEFDVELNCSAEGNDGLFLIPTEFSVHVNWSDFNLLDIYRLLMFLILMFSKNQFSSTSSLNGFIPVIMSWLHEVEVLPSFKTFWNWYLVFLLMLETTVFSWSFECYQWLLNGYMRVVWNSYLSLEPWRLFTNILWWFVVNFEHVYWIQRIACYVCDGLHHICHHSFDFGVLQPLGQGFILSTWHIWYHFPLPLVSWNYRALRMQLFFPSLFWQLLFTSFRENLYFLLWILSALNVSKIYLM